MNPLSPSSSQPMANASPLARVLMALIRAYQIFISPSLGASCRFTPSCSRYAQQALAQHGAGLGLYLSAARLGRCHPWCEGGHDPVPTVLAPPRFFTRFFHD